MQGNKHFLNKPWMYKDKTHAHISLTVTGPENSQKCRWSGRLDSKAHCTHKSSRLNVLKQPSIAHLSCPSPAANLLQQTQSRIAPWDLSLCPSFLRDLPLWSNERHSTRYTYKTHDSWQWLKCWRLISSLKPISKRHLISLMVPQLHVALQCSFHLRQITVGSLNVLRWQVMQQVWRETLTLYISCCPHTAEYISSLAPAHPLGKYSAATSRREPDR